MMWKSILVLSIVIVALACVNTKPKPISEEEKASFLALGDSISTEVQKFLLKNVSEAMKAAGVDHAIDFCNERAVSLTNLGLSERALHIQRLSDRNRNPDNAIRTAMDSLAWERLEFEMTGFVEQDEDGEVYYYKPISIAMPTCLKCHGDKNNIAESSLKLLAEKYPEDKAIGYNVGDLRGMWKIQLSEGR